MSDVDVTKIKDRKAYYAARAKFLEALLAGSLSPKQRREAEAEWASVSVKALRAEAKPSAYSEYHFGEVPDIYRQRH